MILWGLSAPARAIYMYITILFNIIFSSEIAWPIKAEFFVEPFYTPPLENVRGIMLYTPFKNLRLSVRLSVRQRFVSALYLEHVLPIFFKLCLRVDIRKEWFGIIDG